jgi:hypothetical protein
LASEAAIGSKDESSSKYELKKCCRAVLKEYNTKKHSTIYMTPNEAYLQQYIQTRQIKMFTPEEIRRFVVEKTTSKADYFARLGLPIKLGDPVLVKSSLRLKIRLDGTRLLMPPKENHRHGKYTFKATVKKIVGNCYNLEWG